MGCHKSLRPWFEAVDLTDKGIKVIIYQALVKVTGRLRFSLERPGVTGPAEEIYDEIIIGPGGTDQTDLTLVTPRLQHLIEQEDCVRQATSLDFSASQRLLGRCLATPNPKTHITRHAREERERYVGSTMFMAPLHENHPDEWMNQVQTKSEYG